MNTHKVFEKIIVPNATVAVFFDSYEKSVEFADRFIIKMHGRLNPKFTKIPNRIDFSNGSSIKLGYTRYYKDTLKYRGWSFKVLFFDEESSFDEKSIRFLEDTKNFCNSFD